MKIYVASSWRNPLQPGIVHALRRCEHEVYDFRHPAEDNNGFQWTAIESARATASGSTVIGNYKNWSPEEYRDALQHPLAKHAYSLDIDALRNCDAVVYVLPCGRSASWEFGYAMGQGKKGYVIMFEKDDPELMFQDATILTNMNELFDVFLSKEREQELDAGINMRFIDRP